MQRKTFQHQGLSLSYLDSENDAPVLIALHAHWMEAITFTALAQALSPNWRVIALDQRGHGYSSHAATYTREDYLNDLDAFFQHIGLLEPVVLLGNSLGGINAYQFAAKYPERVRALIIEDIGLEVDVDVSFTASWAGTFPTREALDAALGHLALGLKESVRQSEAGWHMAFNPHELMASSKNCTGNYWDAWLKTDCPALVFYGKQSRVTEGDHMEAMASKRPNTKFVSLDGGHVLHAELPEIFNQTVQSFLEGLPASQASCAS